MRRLQIIPIVFILLTSNSLAQSNHDSTFLHQLKIIDSYIYSLDTLKTAINSKVTGNLAFGEFEGLCLHDESNHLIYKFQLDFDTTTSKTIYFKDNKPLKIIDNKKEFYNIENWFDTKGVVVASSTIGNLLIFAEQCIDLFLKLFY